MSEYTENSDYVVSDHMEKQDLFESKYLKKYLFSIGVVSLGVFMGGVVTLGIFAGLFAAAGTSLGMVRIRDTNPELYNWIIDHPGWVELLSTVAFAGIFGLTATGVVGSLVSSILTSVVLDYYAEKEGRIEGVDKLTFGRVIQKMMDFIRNMFSDASSALKKPAKSKTVCEKPSIASIDAEFVNVEPALNCA